MILHIFSRLSLQQYFEPGRFFGCRSGWPPNHTHVDNADVVIWFLSCWVKVELIQEVALHCFAQWPVHSVQRQTFLSNSPLKHWLKWEFFYSSARSTKATKPYLSIWATFISVPAGVFYSCGWLQCEAVSLWKLTRSGEFKPDLGHLEKQCWSLVLAVEKQPDQTAVTSVKIMRYEMAQH